MRRPIVNLLVSSLFMLAACKKESGSGVDNSSVKALSNSFVTELNDLVSTGDGGFIMIGKTWKFGNQDFWIIRYDENFNKVWERVLGGNDDETLHKVCVSKSGEILLGGISDGFGQDTTPFNVNKKIVLYFHCLDKNGNTLWEIAYPFSDWDFKEQFYNQRVTDIIESEKGDFIITGNIGYTQPSPRGGFEIGFSGLLIKVSKKGEFLNSYIPKVSTSNDNSWEAVFETDTSYSVFWNRHLLAGFNEIGKTEQSSADYKNPATGISWPWPLQSIPPQTIDMVKLTTDKVFSFIYFFKNEFYSFNYDYKTKNLNGVQTQSEINNIFSAASSYDNHFLLCDDNAIFYEVDSKQNILLKFNIFEKANAICKLTNNQYVFGIQKGNVITLFKTDDNGNHFLQ
ncbi:MAG: hypothetical protein H6605_05805 [Flavobacteriales bacterium]|nr:hypothetical protein [Flavobacteriales bacterium]